MGGQHQGGVQGLGMVLLWLWEANIRKLQRRLQSNLGFRGWCC